MGWFKVWDEKWLEQTKDVSMEAQAAMIRILCVANTCFDNGRFSHRGKTALYPGQIIAEAGITAALWAELVKAQFIEEVGGFWGVRNWLTFQNEYDRLKKYKGTTKGTSTDVKDFKDVKEVKDLKTKDLNLPPKEAEESESSPHRELCRFWTETLVKATGDKGKFNGRDGKAAVEILKRVSLDRAKEVISWAITVGLKSEFTAGKCGRLYLVDEHWTFLSSKVPMKSATPDKYAHLAGK